MTIKIAHTADNHLKSAQYGRPARGEDFKSALLSAVEEAHKAGAKYILNCGDILDHTRPAIETLFKLTEVHEHLISLGLTMYMISGNHDKTTPPFAGLLRQHEHGIVNVDNQRFKIPDGPEVLALPFMPKDTFLARLEEEAPADVLMWHGQVQDFSGVKLGDSALSLAELPTGKFPTILFGDIHVHEHIQLESGENTFMPGSTEFCREGEPTDKKIFLLEFDGGKLVKHESVDVQSRRVIRKTVLQDGDLVELLEELNGVDLEDPPIVLVKFDRDIPGVISRVHQAIDPNKAIVRCLPLPKVGGKIVDLTANSDISYQDLLLAVLGEGDQELFELGCMLLNPEDLGVDALNVFVSEALGLPQSSNGIPVTKG